MARSGFVSVHRRQRRQRRPTGEPELQLRREPTSQRALAVVARGDAAVIVLHTFRVLAERLDFFDVPADTRPQSKDAHQRNKTKKVVRACRYRDERLEERCGVYAMFVVADIRQGGHAFPGRS